MYLSTGTPIRVLHSAQEPSYNRTLGQASRLVRTNQVWLDRLHMMQYKITSLSELIPMKDIQAQSYLGNDCTSRSSAAVSRVIRVYKRLGYVIGS